MIVSVEAKLREKHKNTQTETVTAKLEQRQHTDTADLYVSLNLFVTYKYLIYQPDAYENKSCFYSYYVMIVICRQKKKVLKEIKICLSFFFHRFFFSFCF